MPTFIDLFAGCGGMSLGFTRAGFDLLGGIEIDATAARTHGMNFFGDPENPAFEHHGMPVDITAYSPGRYAREILELDDPQNCVDLIIGGPPCQAFARVGRAKLREIMQHPSAFLQDTRANLYIQYLEYVEFFNPLAVLMENVPDIMNFGGTNIADEIAFSLDDLGYNCRYTILNTARYGVPQMRQRFFLVGIRNDLGVIPTFPECTHQIQLPQGYQNAHKVALSAKEENFLYRGERTVFDMLRDSYYVNPPEPHPGLPAAITAQEAIEDLPVIDVRTLTKGARKFNTLARYRNDIRPSQYATSMRNWPGFESEEGVFDHVTRYLPRDYKIFSRLKPGDQYPEAYALATRMFRQRLAELEAETGKKIKEGSPEYERLFKAYVPPYDPGKFPNKWRKMEANAPSRTLTAHIGKDTYSHIHYDSAQSRVISVREAARLQSFPDGFKFAGAMNAAFRQIGNAVPPLQAYALAEKIQNLLEEALIQNCGRAADNMPDRERAER